MNDHENSETKVQPNESAGRPSTCSVLSAYRRLAPKAAQTFLMLVDGLLVGAAKRIDNASGTFMAVSIDYLAARHEEPAGALYAIAHHYEAIGDLVSDPDVEFYVVADHDRPNGRAIYPIAIDHGPLGYHRYVRFDHDGQPAGADRRGQADLARFCDTWMRNIRAQQGLVVR